MQSATSREMSTQAGSIKVSKILIHPIKVSRSLAPSLEIGFPSSTADLEKCLVMNDDIPILCAELPRNFCGVCKVYNKRCRGTAVHSTDLVASLTLSSQDDRRFCVIDAVTKRVITAREVPKVGCQDSGLFFAHNLSGMPVGSNLSTNSSRRIFSRWWIACRRPT